jgi:hypothetical protein
MGTPAKLENVDLPLGAGIFPGGLVWIERLVNYG